MSFTCSSTFRINPRSIECKYVSTKRAYIICFSKESSKFFRPCQSFLDLYFLEEKKFSRIIYATCQPTPGPRNSMNRTLDFVHWVHRANLNNKNDELGVHNNCECQEHGTVGQLWTMKQSRPGWDGFSWVSWEALNGKCPPPISLITCLITYNWLRLHTFIFKFIIKLSLAGLYYVVGEFYDYTGLEN